MKRKAAMRGWGRMGGIFAILVGIGLPGKSLGDSEPEFGVLSVRIADKTTNDDVASPGDTLCVEVKDFSGWLIRQVENSGYFEDDAFTKSGDPDGLRKIVDNHVFEAANAAHLALINGEEGDGDSLETILGNTDFKSYAQALLKDKWNENEPREKQLTEVEGRWGGVDVFKALEGTHLFAALSSELPVTNGTIDPDKSVALLNAVEACTQALMKEVRPTLHPKLNDIVFTTISPTNASSSIISDKARSKSHPNSDYEELRFPLTESDENEDVWQELRRASLFKKPMSFTLETVVGGRSVPLNSEISVTRNDSGNSVFQAGSPKFYLQIASPWFTLVAFVIFAAIFLVFMRLALKTDIICDTSGILSPDGLPPYSLARAQMAFWFLVVIGASLFLWIATGKWNILNDTCLWLIGIGSGTALGSAAISSTDDSTSTTTQKNWLPRSKEETRDDLRRRLNQEIANLTGQIANSQPNPDAALQARLANLQSQKESLATYPKGAWNRVMQNWLTDDNVYSFHRYQMFAWTLVLGVYFIVKVFNDRALPVFDNTTFALLGITSATYLGFKFQTAKS